MSDKIPFTIQDLYKTLRRHDKDILKHFNDDDLSDYDYLFYAINSDIMSNALSIVMNILINNEPTAGIDNNARSIIEGFVILKMLGSGEISDTQQKIFRSHFAIVDYENFKKWIKEQKENPVVAEIHQRYNDAVNFLCEHYGCSKKELHGLFVDYDDPLFYLKKHLKDDISFTNLLNKYPIFNEHTLRVYEFYSIMIHPRYIDSVGLEESLQNLRKNYTRLVLDYVVRYLQTGKLIVIDDKAPTFDDDFFKNPLLVNNVNNLKQIDIMFGMLAEDLCILKDGYDGFELFYFKVLNHLIKDMMLCESLGYNEQVISKYKSFIELASVHATINCVNNLDEFKALKNAFAISSKLQLDEHIKAMNLGEEYELSGLKELYDSYYKEKFNLSSYEEFEKGMRENSLYFLNPNEAKSYNKYVRNAIREVFTDDSIRTELFDMYKLSKDMNHASGYNFNSSPGISDFNAHLVMHAVFAWLINLVVYASAVVEEEDHKTKYTKTVIEFLKIRAKFEIESMGIIGKKYEEDYNKYSNH